MSSYEEVLQLIEKWYGNKDNVVSLATIALESNGEGQPRPLVRNVDAFYEDGVFYVTTSGNSKKIQQITQNPEVGFAAGFEGLTGSGIGENLGWVLDPKNAELRTKLREVFADWYDAANNEQDENCVILAIRITRGTIFADHGATHFDIDFVNKQIIE